MFAADKIQSIKPSKLALKILGFTGGPSAEKTVFDCVLVGYMYVLEIKLLNS